MKRVLGLIFAVFITGCSKPRPADNAPHFDRLMPDDLPVAVVPASKPLTLKQLICQLDAVACKKKLRYSVEQQWMGYSGYGYIWIGFAWPRETGWLDAVQRFPTYQTHGTQTTREECAKVLLQQISEEPPNEMPDIQPVDAEHPIKEFLIDGPLNCDPHRQCK